MTACEMTVLHEVVYIAPMPAVIAAPALAVFAAFAPLVEYSAPARQVAAQSGVHHVESGHEAVCEQREWLAHLPGRVRAIGSSVAVSNFVGQQREAGIGARLKTVEVFVANANPPLGTSSAQERFKRLRMPCLICLLVWTWFRKAPSC